jgi:hypothetical protein
MYAWPATCSGALRMRLRLVPLLCSLLVWCCAHATGAEPSPQTSGRRIAPTATMELQHLIDLTAHELGVTIEYTPASIKQSVTVRSPAGLEPRELWDAS